MCVYVLTVLSSECNTVEEACEAQCQQEITAGRDLATSSMKCTSILPGIAGPCDLSTCFKGMLTNEKIASLAQGVFLGFPAISHFPACELNLRYYIHIVSY